MVEEESIDLLQPYVERSMVYTIERSFYEKLLTTALFVILFTINIIQIVFLVEEIWLDEYY